MIDEKNLIEVLKKKADEETRLEGVITYEGEIYSDGFVSGVLWSVETVKQQPECDRWIPVSERLPKEEINLVTNDYYAYPVTVNISGTTDVRYYKFGDGHWWNNSPFPADEYVVAWMDRPEPWEGEK